MKYSERVTSFVIAVCLLGGTAGVWAQDPCVVPNNGSGTVTLPPPGCEYLSPDEFHEIVDGLPPGTKIIMKPIHRDFICEQSGGSCEQPGGSLGGAIENFNSTLELQLTGTGALMGFNRTITIPLFCETHTAPRNPGDPVQDFDTDMHLLQGQITGDPDFGLLRVTGGTGFGFPSPGHTTLYDQGNGNYLVDSSFKISYKVEFQGAPGGVLAGWSGTTIGTTTVSAVRSCR